MDLEFRILGPLEIVYDGGSLAVAGNRERTLLALLLLSANRVVSSERLADDLWAGEPPETATQVLRVFVSRLRRTLREAGSDGLLLTQPPGYVIRVEPKSLDAACFESLVAEGRDQTARGDSTRAAATLREALALWRGPALSDVADAPGARAEAARLEEVRLAVLEDRIDADLACGRHVELVPELDGWTRAEPLRERLWAQRMLALYRAGRQAEALRAYQDLRRFLGEELGIEPTTTLATLETAILRHDPELDWRPTEQAAPLSPPPQPEATKTAPLTILFTDVVGSTELLSKLGDEQAQRVFGAHHELLAETVAAHGGRTVKWLGDGVMAAFFSVVEAVRCAIAIQRAEPGPIGGVRLTVRVGLDVGEVLEAGSDYSGAAVVAANRLCARAAGGQILCSSLVAQLVTDRAQFSLSALGPVDLPGVGTPVVAFEVGYEAAPIQERLRQMPFTGREAELGHLEERLAEAALGRGGLVMLVGEPGIGKTRLAEEVSGGARRGGWSVAWGRCFEGDWMPAYAPFAEVIESLALASEPEQRPSDLGSGAPVLAQLVPRLHDLLPGIEAPVTLQPDEERFRLLDAVADHLLGRSEQRPLLLCLDDLHWADTGSVAMLTHLANLMAKHRLLVVGTYRGTEVGPGHPLAEALPTLGRRPGFERLQLQGLPAEAVGALLDALTSQEVPGTVAAALAGETDGNPFFLREVLRHLIEEGKVFRDETGLWTTELTVEKLGIPQTVREIIGRRLTRLSEAAHRFLSVACAFEGPFGFDVVAGAAGLAEEDGLDALDETLSSHLLEEVGAEGAFGFTHALIRHTLYSEVSTPRRSRLHRTVAEALEAASGDRPDPARAGEIAHHYRRSSGLAGAHRGVDYALQAAEHSEATGAHDEAARFLRTALELLPDGDARRPRILGRLGVALIWALAFDEAVPVAVEAGKAIAESEGPGAATQYLAETAYACVMAGSSPHAWQLARHGLGYAGDRRDVAWAQLVSFDSERRAAEDPEHPGIPIDAPERRESARILRAAHLDPFAPAPMEAVFSSREEAKESTNAVLRATYLGEVEAFVPAVRADIDIALAQNRFARALRGLNRLGCAYTTLGRLAEARQTLEQADALSARLGRSNFFGEAQEQLCGTLDEGWEEARDTFWPLAESAPPATAWALGYIRATSMRIAAHLGDRAAALRFLDLLVPWLERAPMWTLYIPSITAYPAEALWLLDCRDHVEVVEAAIREKVIAPDFRSSFADGRLSLARLCALTGRYEEAVSWFAESRLVLAEIGARQLLAQADFDE
ncbi:MAG TPA: BTAD domain-containing putative transcriptional regulator, partial [Acidimicrobiia bacterium]|nr:BTAD domain-containing putative transcriptional regulator [Acidimicrobiia bacterium]